MSGGLTLKCTHIVRESVCVSASVSASVNVSASILYFDHKLALRATLGQQRNLGLLFMRNRLSGLPHECRKYSLYVCVSVCVINEAWQPTTCKCIFAASAFAAASAATSPFPAWLGSLHFSALLRPARFLQLRFMLQL